MSASTTDAGVTSAGPRLMIACGLALAFSALYAACPPDVTFQSWDSLSYAYAAETEGLRALWGNHPLGHVFLNGTLNIFRHLGYQGRALPLFQTVNSTVSGLAVAGMFLLCCELDLSPLGALGIALILGASPGFWLLAGAADIYSVAFVLGIASWGTLLRHTRSDEGRSLWLPGSCTGLAILAHQLNFTMVPAALLLILMQGTGRHPAKRVLTFAGGCGCAVITGYAVLGYLATASTAPSVIIRWMRGYAGDVGYGGHLVIASLPIAWSTLSGAIVHTAFQFIRPDVALVARLARGVLVGLLCATTAYGIVGYRRLGRVRQAALAAALLQFLCGAMLTVWWAPFHQRFWVLTLLPWLIAIACSSSGMRLPPRVGQLAAGAGRHGTVIGNHNGTPTPVRSDRLPILLGVGIFLFNLPCMLVFEARPAPQMKTALDHWLEHSQPGDVLIPPDGLIPLLRYWADRPNTLHMYICLKAGTPDDVLKPLREAIDDRLRCSGKVLFAPAALDALGDDEWSHVHASRAQLRQFFKRYRLTEAFSTVDPSRGTSMPVYQLTASGASAAADPPSRTALHCGMLEHNTCTFRVD